MNRFPKCFVGPEEPKQMWAQQVGVPPKSEKRKRKGTEVEKGGGGGAGICAFDFKGATCKLYSKSHANDMQMAFVDEHLFFLSQQLRHFWVSPPQLSPRVAQGQGPSQDL